MEMLLAVRWVDMVITYEEPMPEYLCSLIRPDVIVKSREWQMKGVSGSSYAKRVCFFETVPGISTTRLCDRIRGRISVPLTIVGEEE
jgi:bifunctional ADP-heptose synthase (sugar kinase/adenylyltransferase)